MLFLSINLHYFIVSPFLIYFSSWLRICGLKGTITWFLQGIHIFTISVHLLITLLTHCPTPWCCTISHNKKEQLTKQLQKDWKQNERIIESEIKQESVRLILSFTNSVCLSLKFANVFLLEVPLNVHMQITSWKIVPNSGHICDFSLKKLVEMAFIIVALHNPVQKVTTMNLPMSLKTTHAPELPWATFLTNHRQMLGAKGTKLSDCRKYSYFASSPSYYCIHLVCL